MSLTEKDYLKKHDIRILILSRSRFTSIKKNTLKLFPDWVEVVVPMSQREDYESEIDNPLITTPDNIIGLGMLRNWVLDNFKEKTIIMVDDDILSLYSLTGQNARRIEDSEEVIQILINTAVMANDLGISCFGFSQKDIRMYHGTSPFLLNGWVGCVIGVIGRKYRFREDKFKVDIDFCLQNLLVDRIVWTDDRYMFAQERDNNTGGNSEFRTQENLETSMESLVAKWSPYVVVNKTRHSNNVSIRMNVARRQAIKYE